MKRVFIFVLFVFLLAGCAASTDINEQDASTLDTDEQGMPEQVDGDEQDTPEQPVQIPDQIPFIDIAWPEYPDYRPESKVYPLTSEPHIYKSGVEGPITFIDEQLNPITLPFESLEYATIEGAVNAKSEWRHVAYALNIGKSIHFTDADWILMHIDGTIPRGTDGEYIRLSDAGDDGPWFYNGAWAVVTYHDGFGLYNLKERRQVLPNNYEWIQVIDRCMFLALKDGQGWLISADGRELYAFGDVAEMGYFIDTRFHQSASGTHYLNAEKQAFFSFDGFNDYRVIHAITQNIEGEREEEEYVRLVDYDSEGYYLRDGQGTILLSIPSSEGYLVQCGDFILQKYYYDDNDPMRNRAKAVYSLSGKLLLDNVFGFISEVTAPGDGLFVYTSPDHCVLLYPDGSMIDVKAAPKVEFVYWKG